MEGNREVTIDLERFESLLSDETKNNVIVSMCRSRLEQELEMIKKYGSRDLTDATLKVSDVLMVLGYQTMLHRFIELEREVKKSDSE